MITIQNYVRAGSLEEAYQLNQDKKNRILGGMMWLKVSAGGAETAEFAAKAIEIYCK